MHNLVAMLATLICVGTGVAYGACLTEDGHSDEMEPSGALRQMSGAGVHSIRTFRIAVAATAEYTHYHGSKTAAIAAARQTVAQASEIFEREVGIRFQIVEALDRLVYEDPSSDPFSSNEPTAEVIQQAQSAFDQVIGSPNYDLGIALTRGTGGLAYLRSVCDPARKGSACIGSSEPNGNAAHVALVAHEIAHQFGALHTFNSQEPLCGARRNPESAVEPGTGSTLMSYAGFSCEGDAFQNTMDHYFHSVNLAQMRAYLRSGASCALVEPSGNNEPQVAPLAEYTIPARTPFELRASATDPDGDSLTYSWEQRNVGPARSLYAPDDGHGPLFRSYPPTPVPTRTFPALPYILNDSAPAWEQLPTTSRTLEFRVAVRDSRNNGATALADVPVWVVDTGRPFRITSFNTATQMGRSARVTWDVAETTEAPISASAVRISLSLDGGITFGTVLADSTANDGSEDVTFPAIQSTNARIRIQPTNNIFFDINDAPLTLTDAAELRVKATQHPSGEMQITWNSSAGKTYRVETSSSLTGQQWELAKTFAGAEGESTTTVPIQNVTHRFVRVVEQ